MNGFRWIPKNLRTWSVKNPAILLTVISFFVAGARLIGVSRGNTEVLKALVQTLSIPSLVLSTILPLMPSILIFGLFAGIDRYLLKRKQSKKPKIAIQYYMFGAAVIFAVSMYVPIIYIGICLVAIFLVHFLHYMGTKTGRQVPRFEFEYLGISLIIVAIFVNFSMWIPQENLRLSSGETRTGYILASDVRWTTFLQSEGSLEMLPTMTISERQPCLPNAPHRSSITIADIGDNPRAQLPVCLKDSGRPTNAGSQPADQEDHLMTTFAWWLISIALVIALAALATAAYAFARSGTIKRKAGDEYRFEAVHKGAARLLTASEQRKSICSVQENLTTGKVPDGSTELLAQMKLLQAELKLVAPRDIADMASMIVDFHEISLSSFHAIDAGYVETAKNKVQTIPPGALAANQTRASMTAFDLTKTHNIFVKFVREYLGVVFFRTPKPDTPTETTDVESNNSEKAK